MRRLLVLPLLLLLTGCPHRGGTGPGPGEGTPRIEAKPSQAADDALQKAIGIADTRSRKEAIAALLEVRKKYPQSTAGQQALYRAGVLAWEEGDYATARKALNELVFENPLFEKADDARLKSGLAAVEMHAYRDAYQTLSSLVDHLEGADKKLAEEALERAAAGSQQYSEALRMGLKAVESASGPEEIKAAMAKLEDVVENRTTFLSIAEAWHNVPTTHPAWPMLTFKMARVYYHLRDFASLEDALKSLLQNAPSCPYANDAKELLAKISRRVEVRPKAVGAVLPLKGKYKGLGDAVLRGLQLALKGSDIELVVKDSEGDPTLAAKLVEELAVTEGVIAIVGPLLGDDSRRAALAAEELQVPLITLTRTDGITEIGPHIFRTMVTNAQQAEALADYAVGTLGIKTFAVLYPNIPFGVELADDFWSDIEKRGGQMRGAESYDHDQKTFTSEVKKLVGRYFLEDRADFYEMLRTVREQNLDDFHRRRTIEKMRDKLEPVIDFEALLLPDSWDRVSLVAPALAVEDIVTNACDKKDLERIQKTTGKDKLKTVTLLGPGTWSSPKGTSGDPMLIERGGKYVLCAVYVDAFYEGSERPQTKAFVDTFRGVHKDAAITLLDAVAFDTAGLVRSVIEKSAPKTRAAFRERLGAVKGFEGATGTISFDDNREARRPLFLLNVTPKGIKEIPPKPQG